LIAISKNCSILLPHRQVIEMKRDDFVEFDNKLEDIYIVFSTVNLSSNLGSYEANWLSSLISFV